MKNIGTLVTFMQQNGKNNSKSIISLEKKQNKYKFTIFIYENNNKRKKHE